MRKKENLFRSRVVKDLASFCSEVQSNFNPLTRGLSDLSATIKGIHVLLEIKESEDSEYTNAQCVRLMRHVRSGGLGLFIHPHNWDYILDFLKTLKGASHCPSFIAIRKYAGIQLKCLSEKKKIKTPDGISHDGGSNNISGRKRTSLKCLTKGNTK